MATSIHVGGLNQSTTKSDLQHLFEQYGPVEEVEILKGKRLASVPGNSAVVLMLNADEAMKAMTNLSGKDFEGRKIRVRQAFSRRTA